MYTSAKKTKKCDVSLLELKGDTNEIVPHYTSTQKEHNQKIKEILGSGILGYLQVHPELVVLYSEEPDTQKYPDFNATLKANHQSYLFFRGPGVLVPSDCKYLSQDVAGDLPRILENDLVQRDRFIREMEESEEYEIIRV